MDVVLRHQRDGDAVPPWSATKNRHRNFKASLQTQDEDSASKSGTLTCSCRSSDSVDVDLGKSGGVVVNDNLDCRNVQTSGAS